MKARRLLLTRADLDAAARDLEAARALREKHGRVLVEGLAVAPYSLRFFEGLLDYLRGGTARPSRSAAERSASGRIASRALATVEGRKKTKAARDARRRVGL